MEKSSKETIAERLLRIDWPNTRDGRRWSQSSPSFKRLCHYAKELLEIGMTADQIAFMFGDLYWDAFGEFKKTPSVSQEVNESGSTVAHFDKHQIMFRLDAENLSPEELKRDFKFYCNVFAEGESIKFTHSGGGTSGGPLHSFLMEIRLDRCYAFGPTKKQAGWSLEKLAKLNSVGVYSRKETSSASKKKKRKVSSPI